MSNFRETSGPSVVNTLRKTLTFLARVSGGKDFESYEEDSKDQTVTEMKELLTNHNAVAIIPSTDVLTEIDRIVSYNFLANVEVISFLSLSICLFVCLHLSVVFLFYV